jgi:hypothetical protein
MTENKPLKIKDSDLRYTTKTTFDEIKKLTGEDFSKAYDPTPVNPKKDAFKLNWIAPKIWLNPPFSKARFFVKKLMDEMDKNKTIKKAAIILPWYFVENYAGRVTSGAKWWPSLRKRMTPYNYKRFHLGNQPFKRPDGKEIMVRVYAIYLSR